MCPWLQMLSLMTSFRFWTQYDAGGLVTKKKMFMSLLFVENIITCLQIIIARELAINYSK